MKRIVHIVLGLMLSTILLAPAAAQTSAPPPGQTSLGDYARKVRKEPAATKATPKLFDNDNLPKDDKLSIVGQPAPPPAATSAAATEKSSTPSDNKTAAEAKPKESAGDDQAKKE